MAVVVQQHLVLQIPRIAERMRSLPERRTAHRKDVLRHEPVGTQARVLAAAVAYSHVHVAAGEVRELRRHLLELDDRLLDDIGFSRAMARREAAKPFWKD